MKNLLLLLAFYLLVNNPQSARAQLMRWHAADGGNDHYYEVVPAVNGITWNDASSSATNRGGYLATITSASENNFVFNLASQQTNIWYGGYGPWLGGIQPAGSAEPSGGWTWVTGEPFIYQNWAPAQPNNNGGAESRLHFGGLATMSSAWNDVSPTATNFTRGFIVEYPNHPNSVDMSVRATSRTTVELSWASRTNVPYIVEWTEVLPSAFWNPLTSVSGNGMTNVVETPSTEPRRFYRIVAPE